MEKAIEQKKLRKMLGKNFGTKEKKMPYIIVEGRESDPSDWYVLKNTYKVLEQNLAVTKESEELNEKLEKQQEEHTEENEFQTARRFAEEENEKDSYLGGITENTYNGDSVLYGTLQYSTFVKGDKDFVVLQVHQGGDVRGNYSRPQVFEVREGIDHLIMENTDLHASVGEKGYYSDDAGYHWYDEDHSNDATSEVKSWKYDAKKKAVYAGKEKVEFG